MDPAIKCQPSARTNNINLKGRDIITGGSIIIPMERRMLEITTSRIRNGTYNKNPI
jgi:hypothetical protein